MKYALSLLMVVALLVAMPLSAENLNGFSNDPFRLMGIVTETKIEIQEEVTVEKCCEMVAIRPACIETGSFSYVTAAMVHTDLEVIVQPGESRGGALLNAGFK